MQVLQNLQWRYATKKFDASKRVSQENIDKILEAARLAPSSSGLQPYKIIVITNPELKSQLVAHSYDQQQIADCSHLLVFAAWEQYTNENIDEVFLQTIRERKMPENSFDAYASRLKSVYLKQTALENFAHSARQVYISMAMAMVAAAELKVDATPMEGFDNAAYDELLHLKERGLKSVTLLPVGYRDATNDWLVNLKKVRQSKEDFIIEIQ